MPNSFLSASDQEPGGSGGAWHTHSARAELWFLGIVETLPVSQEGKWGACGKHKPVARLGWGLNSFLRLFWGGSVTGADQGRRWFDLL